MPNTDWNQLSHLQLGRYAEYFAKMEFASYSLEVYSSEVEAHVNMLARHRLHPQRQTWQFRRDPGQVAPGYGVRLYAQSQIRHPEPESIPGPIILQPRPAPRHLPHPGHHLAKTG